METSPTQASSPIASDSSTPPASNEIPESLRGDWAQVDEADGNSVSAEQCDIQTAPWGKLITVEATSIQYFETVAELESVQESDSNSLTAQFSIQYGDTLSSIGIELEGENDGQVLITTDFTEDEESESLRYLRCPG